MKNKIYYLLTILACVFLSGCFNDDSSLSDGSVKDITVDGFAQSYVATAYTDKPLKISPSVKIGSEEANADNAVFQWYLINDKTGKVTSKGDTIQPIVIGHNKDLDYDVAVAPGKYQLRYEVTDKQSGYTVFKYAPLYVQTVFSQGFFILKQTPDGNTDVDVLNEDGTLSQNILQKTSGSPMAGKPLNLAALYNSCYINEETNEMEAVDAISVTTEANNFGIYRATDFKRIFDKSNLSFEPLDDTEKPYGFLYASVLGHVYFSTGGARSASGPSYDGSLNSGKYGMPFSNIQGSQYFCHDIPSYGGIFLWDNATHGLYAMNYIGDVSPLQYDDLTGSDITQNLTDYDCLTCGYNLINRVGTAVFVLEDKKNGDRYLYQTKSDFNQMYLKRRDKIPADFHLAKSSLFSVNASSAKYIYCVNNNKVYATIFSDDNLSEVEIPVKIGAGEMIAYIGNQFYYNEFNYLVVGTQKGDHYKLYFFKLVGGTPDGDAVLTAEGTGSVASVKFLHNGFDSRMWDFSIAMYNANN